MNDSSNICLSCGLCCDGTVIGFVQVDNDEIADLRKIKVIEEEDGNSIFLQPCERFCNGCTIYDQRPKQCASFKCGLLTDVEENKVAFHSAVETIERVKQLKSDIEKQIESLEITLDSNSFYFKTLELKKRFRELGKPSASVGQHQELIIALRQFDAVLLEKFGLN